MFYMFKGFKVYYDDTVFKYYVIHISVPPIFELRESAEISAVGYTNLNGIVHVCES